ncbi:MAG: GFA family protein [Hyphomicrobiaceae bacterium]|nr:GFA family protein [Hyphomicrobiaceae bacterium]
MQPKHASLELSARCPCGTVSISVRGPIYGMFLCCCSDCQLMSGAGHSAVAIAGRDQVQLEGEITQFSRPAASGATFTRHFCAKCGTTLLGGTSRRTDAALLPVGLFADQSWFEPNQVIFHRSHQKWDLLPDIPKYETYREGL